jgi:hypothetical protein
MLCPECEADSWKISDSRRQEGTNSIRRRRRCLECGARFTTHEYIFESSRGPGLDPALIEAIAGAEELRSEIARLKEKLARIGEIIGI